MKLTIYCAEYTNEDDEKSKQHFAPAPDNHHWNCAHLHANANCHQNGNDTL